MDAQVELSSGSISKIHNIEKLSALACDWLVSYREALCV